jgi:signal peptidase II
MKKRNIYFIIVVFILVLIDQISKLLVTNVLKSNVIIVIKSLLKFLYVKNTGAAFGILSGNIFILVLITFILIIYVFNEIKKNSNNKLMLSSYLLILSGALGNLIDRLFRGYVVDFISFTFFGKDMAVFNIADSYITIGIIMLIFALIKEIFYGRNSNK